MSEEQKAKIRATTLGKPKGPRKSPGPLSPEHRAKISASRRQA
jgi:hypothetical protein